MTRKVFAVPPQSQPSPGAAVAAVINGTPGDDVPEQSRRIRSTRSPKRHDYARADQTTSGGNDVTRAADGNDLHGGRGNDCRGGSRKRPSLRRFHWMRIGGMATTGRQEQGSQIVAEYGNDSLFGGWVRIACSGSGNDDPRARTDGDRF
jgi:hypothetical protein